MSVGLIGLLDDIAAIAKVAAASLDDVASQAAKAGVKAAGVVIDDTAVTPGYVIGFEPKRELPIVGKIAAGSLRNKLLVLLPAALLLSYFLPWTITPLLMLGGAYLCYEGVEKVLEAVMPHSAQQHEAQLGTVALNATSVEDQKVASAIKTDFILSAEIMAITLAALPSGSIWKQALVLAVVAIGITLAVYGVVALIVKADDVGVALARSGSRLSRAVGRGIVRGRRARLCRMWHGSRHGDGHFDRVLGPRQPGFLAARAADRAAGRAETGGIDRIGCRTVGADNVHGRIAGMTVPGGYRRTVNESETITAAQPFCRVRVRNWRLRAPRSAFPAAVPAKAEVGTDALLARS